MSFINCSCFSPAKIPFSGPWPQASPTRDPADSDGHKLVTILHGDTVFPLWGTWLGHVPNSYLKEKVMSWDGDAACWDRGIGSWLSWSFYSITHMYQSNLLSWAKLTCSWCVPQGIGVPVLVWFGMCWTTCGVYPLSHLPLCPWGLHPPAEPCCGSSLQSWIVPLRDLFTKGGHG